MKRGLKRGRSLNFSKVVHDSLVDEAPLRWSEYIISGYYPDTTLHAASAHDPNFNQGAKARNGFVGKKGVWTNLQIRFHHTAAYDTASQMDDTHFFIAVAYQKPGSGVAETGLFYDSAAAAPWAPIKDPTNRDEFVVLYEKEETVWFQMVQSEMTTAGAIAAMTGYKTYPSNDLDPVYLDMDLDLPFTVDASGEVIDGDIYVYYRCSNTNGYHSIQTMMTYKCDVP